jgi:predicted anti-sigma-YlaC factor YlaD
MRRKIKKMKCKNVRKKIFSYIDKELSNRESSKIQNHLNECAYCKKQYDILSVIFTGTENYEKAIPSPYLWTRLSSKIEEFEKCKSHFWIRIPKFAESLVMVVLFLISITIGIFLGNFPNLNNSETTDLKPALTENDKFVRSSYVETFDDLPPQSVGGVYVSLEFEKR